MANWFTRRRRRRILALPFPEGHLAILHADFGPWASLSDGERGRLCDIVQVLLAEKHWQGCGGLELSDRIRVVIAAQAALLLLGLDHDYYRNVTEILVYPHAWRGSRGARLAGGGVTDEPSVRLGEAWLQGPVVLAWDAALAGARNPSDARNVVYHEFAHKLDMLDGAADGVPPLAEPAAYGPWYRAMMDQYEALGRRLERGQPTLLDPYGAQSPEEFFAVAVEAFFEQGPRLDRTAPALYAVLRTYFRQHPAGRTRRPRGSTPSGALDGQPPG